MDATKITAELGWEPAYTFERGIAETIDWYIDHQQWWNRVITGEYQDYYKAQYREV